ncbi:MAG: hypothetical protein AAF865_00840 [Pseudomonadota bacterium]
MTRDEYLSLSDEDKMFSAMSHLAAAASGSALFWSHGLPKAPDGAEAMEDLTREDTSSFAEPSNPFEGKVPPASDDPV